MPAQEQEVLKAALKHLSSLHAKQTKRQKKDEEQEPAFSDCMAMYCEWHQRLVSIGPHITPREGKALKVIIKYLRENSKQKDDEGVKTAWEFILRHWDKLTLWLQKQMRLSQIERNLPEIISSIKQHATIQNRNNTSAQIADRIARRKFGHDK